jgi:hypothetical protein
MGRAKLRYIGHRGMMHVECLSLKFVLYLQASRIININS